MIAPGHKSGSVGQGEPRLSHPLPPQGRGRAHHGGGDGDAAVLAGRPAGAAAGEGPVPLAARHPAGLADRRARRALPGSRLLPSRRRRRGRPRPPCRLGGQLHRRLPHGALLVPAARFPLPTPGQEGRGRQPLPHPPRGLRWRLLGHRAPGPAAGLLRGRAVVRGARRATGARPGGQGPRGSLLAARTGTLPRGDRPVWGRGRPHRVPCGAAGQPGLRRAGAGLLRLRGPAPHPGPARHGVLRGGGRGAPPAPQGARPRPGRCRRLQRSGGGPGHGRLPAAGGGHGVDQRHGLPPRQPSGLQGPPHPPHPLLHRARHLHGAGGLGQLGHLCRPPGPRLRCLGHPGREDPGQGPLRGGGIRPQLQQQALCRAGHGADAAGELPSALLPRGRAPDRAPRLAPLQHLQHPGHPETGGVGRRSPTPRQGPGALVAGDRPVLGAPPGLRRRHEAVTAAGGPEKLGGGKGAAPRPLAPLNKVHPGSFPRFSSFSPGNAELPRGIPIPGAPAFRCVP